MMSASIGYEELKISPFLSAHPPRPVASLIACKELLQLWKQPEQLRNDYPAECMAVPGIRYELPSRAINIWDIKYSKLHDAQSTPAG